MHAYPQLGLRLNVLPRLQGPPYPQSFMPTFASPQYLLHMRGTGLCFSVPAAEKLCPMPHTCAAFSSPTNRIAFDIHRPTVTHRWLLSVDRHDDRPRLTVTRPRDDYLFFIFCPADPAWLLQQLHNNPSQQNYDDLTDAVTKSASKKAEMFLLDIFVLALEFIKNVRGGSFESVSLCRD